MQHLPARPAQPRPAQVNGSGSGGQAPSAAAGVHQQVIPRQGEYKCAHWCLTRSICLTFAAVPSVQGAGWPVGPQQAAAHGWLCVWMQLPGHHAGDHEGGWESIVGWSLIKIFIPKVRLLVIMQVEPDCMRPLIGPLLRAMHRLAKEHNQSPTAGLLSAKADQPAGWVAQDRIAACLASTRLSARISRFDASSSACQSVQGAANGGYPWVRLLVHVARAER